MTAPFYCAIAVATPGHPRKEEQMQTFYRMSAKERAETIYWVRAMLDSPRLTVAEHERVYLALATLKDIEGEIARELDASR